MVRYVYRAFGISTDSVATLNNLIIRFKKNNYIRISVGRNVKNKSAIKKN